MRVIAWNRSRTNPVPPSPSSISTSPFAESAPSLHLLLHDETHGFLSAERIARLRPGVILVNTARAALVDEPAMIAALKSGHTSATPRWTCSTPNRCPKGTS